MARPRTYSETETRVFNVLGIYWCVTTITEGWNTPETMDEPTDGEETERIIGLTMVTKQGKAVNYDFQLVQANQAVESGMPKDGEGVLAFSLLNASRGLLDSEGWIGGISHEITHTLTRDDIIKLLKGKS
jgi:hypothetical protein